MGQRSTPYFLRLAFLSPQPTVLLQSYCQHIQEMHQHENGLTAKEQVYTNVSPTDQDHNGQTLTLKVDQTFTYTGETHSWKPDLEKMWNWDSTFFIDGVWSYDKQAKIITLTATNFHANLNEPFQNQQDELNERFSNRVVSTPNFDLETSKEIRCFYVRSYYGDFYDVIQRALPRK